MSRMRGGMKEKDGTRDGSRQTGAVSIRTSVVVMSL